MTSQMCALRVEKISKSFDKKAALIDVTFRVNTGEIIAVLGPSGCGKSTLLAVIAGLESCDSGDVFWNGESIKHVPPHLRGFGLMFQELALFPHLNVFDNIAFGLRMDKKSPAEIQSRVKEMLDLVGLIGFDRRDVSTLSGGEQQRVALARALVPQPDLLMLDEPMGALDRSLRERLISEIATILRRIEQTAIYVTHDQEEAFSIADNVVLMNDGSIEQIATPQEMYRKPTTPFAARFLGFSNLLPASTRFREGHCWAMTSIGEFPIEDTNQEQVTILLRPDAVQLEGPAQCVIEGRIIERSFLGGICRIVVKVAETRLSFDLKSNTHIPEDEDDMRIYFDPGEALWVIP